MRFPRIPSMSLPFLIIVYNVVRARSWSPKIARFQGIRSIPSKSICGMEESTLLEPGYTSYALWVAAASIRLFYVHATTRSLDVCPSRARRTRLFRLHVYLVALKKLCALGSDSSERACVSLKNVLSRYMHGSILHETHREFNTFGSLTRTGVFLWHGETFPNIQYHRLHEKPIILVSISQVQLGSALVKHDGVFQSEQLRVFDSRLGSLRREGIMHLYDDTCLSYHDLHDGSSMLRLF